VGDRKILKTNPNSASKNTSETDIFPNGPKSLLTSIMYEVCKYTHFFTINMAVTKQNVGDGENPLTYLNSALKVLLGLHSLPRVPKKS
jgi:hypothetical protein